jgi:hypothetical protein
MRPPIPGSIVHFNRSLATFAQTAANLDRLFSALERLEQTQVQLAALTASLERVMTMVEDRFDDGALPPGPIPGDGLGGSATGQPGSSRSGARLARPQPGRSTPPGARPGPTEEHRSWRA